MRTIIINTLGKDMPRHELLFLPFRDDQLVWLNTNMGGIGACAKQIEDLHNAQDKRQDYRLMVLADLGGYGDIDREEIRSCYRSILGAYMNAALFQPLAEDKKIPPKTVSVVYMLSRITKGSGRITGGRQYDYVLSIPEDRPFASLELVRLLEDGREERLDVTPIFATLIKASGVGKECGDPEKHSANLNHFRKHLPQILENLQKCRYTPSGSLQSEVIAVNALEFFPKCTDPDLIWADLQLNLSDMLAQQSRMRRDRPAELKLTAHTEEELAFRFRRGLHRVRTLLREAPDQTYFPLENRTDFSPRNLTNKIRAALIASNHLPDEEQDPEDQQEEKASSEKKRSPGRIRKSWLRIDREKAQFESLCVRLRKEYDPEAVMREQQEILELCAREFRNWRSDVLAAKQVAPDESEAIPGVIPKLDTSELEEKLHKAQIRCSAIAADKLEDYLDLRQEAEDIKADFRKSAKLWGPDCRSANTKYFVTYSLVLAVLFLIQMIVPYVGITMGQSSVELSGYLHFFTGTAVFIGLYIAGLLVWLRQLCGELCGHRQRLLDLIDRSSQRRRESIEAVIKAYGQELPQCTVHHENLQELRMLHALNLDRYARYRTHMEMLERAEELLQELETELQLPQPAMDRLYKPERVTRGIDYQQPPCHVGNIPYYMLLSDEWGDRVC